MSIWISKPLCILALVGLTACQMVEIVPAARNVTVFDGSVLIMPPSGYCVDAKSSSQGDEAVVVLMGRCKASSGRVAALLTATLGAGGSADALSPGPVALTSFFNTDEGLAMMAASGDPKDVQIDESQIDGETLFLKITDVETGTYWRAITGLKGHLLTLTAAGTGRVALNPVDGRELLSKALLALQKANTKRRVPIFG